MAMEQTYLMVKPDGVQRGICGEIISRFEKKGLKLVAMKLMVIPEATAKKHYAEHEGKKFFPSLISYITSGPVLAMVWEGDNAVQVCRNLMGKTNPANAEVGTIRGDFSPFMSFNVIHGSDGPESAEREIAIYFNEDEICDKWQTSFEILREKMNR